MKAKPGVSYRKQSYENYRVQKNGRARQKYQEMKEGPTTIPLSGDFVQAYNPISESLETWVVDEDVMLMEEKYQGSAHKLINRNLVASIIWNQKKQRWEIKE